MTVLNTTQTMSPESGNANVIPLYRQECAKPGKLKRIDILLGVNDAAIRDGIERLFPGEPYHVHLVESGEQLLSQLEQRDYDLVILSEHMPDLKGADAAKIFRFMRPDRDGMPIAVLAGRMAFDRSSSDESEHMGYTVINGEPPALWANLYDMLARLFAN